jgi:hypothetical protein
VWIAIGLSIVLLAACGIYITQRNVTLSRGFTSVTQGSTREQVISLMGEPNIKLEGCQDAVTWLERPVVGKKCSSQYRYDAKLLPKYWTVGFDEKGRAIAKYEYVSP